MGTYSTASGSDFTLESIMADVVAGTNTLTFIGLAAGDHTAFIDNVSVMTVPEPSTWAMMLLGIAGLGFAGYRRSHKVASIAA